jgi:NitT/TauT family transport system substrate-binding protein
MRVTDDVPRLVVMLVLSMGAALGACAPAPATPPAAPPSAAPAAPAGAAPPPAAPPAAAQAAPAASASTTRSAPTPLSPPVRVKVGSVGTVAERGVFIGLERGYFAEEGLEVELVPYSGDQIPALLTGDLDIGVGGATPGLFNAAQRGVGVKIVSYLIIVGRDDDSSAFVVRKDHVDSGRYREPKDFKGFTVALVTAPLSQLYLEKLLAPAGLTLADVETTPLPFPDMVPALANRGVDAAFLAEPFISVVETQGLAKDVMPMGDVWPGVVGSVMMMSPQFAEQQPEAARRFVTAHLRGQRDYYRAVQANEGGRDEIVQILIKYTPIKDPRLYARLLTSPVDPNSELDQRPLDEIQDYFVRIGLLPQRIDVGQVLDRSYADYALQRLGRLP